MDKSKYCGIIPAFYACYGEDGNVSVEAIEKLTELLISKGVKGLYVGGSSGECIYQSVEERKTVLEAVVKSARGRITVIAHVACNSTRDSCILAAHAESVGVDAIAAIPPIYYKLPDYAVADYWNAISASAPNTDFIIYNIPGCAGVALTPECLKTMLKNPRVIGVKNSSMPTMDIQTFRAIGGDDFVIFNGPDEQLAAGLSMGADGGIGGTYGVMPELYIKIMECILAGDVSRACKLELSANEIIRALCSCHGSMYAVIKEIIRIRDGIDIGDVRSPFPSLTEEDMPTVRATAALIDGVLSSL